MTQGHRFRQLWFSALVIVIIVRSIQCSGNSRNLDRNVNIINNSGRTIEIYWVDRDSEDNIDSRVLMSDPDLVNGAEFTVDSWVGHVFEAREKPNKETGKCAFLDDTDGLGVCRSVTMEISENDDQVFRVNADFEVVFMDSKIKAQQEAGDLVAACKQVADDAISKAGSDIVLTRKAMEDLVTCVQGGVANTLEKVHEEISFQADIRQKIAGALENYTCVDDALNSTEDIREEAWIDPKDEEMEYVVHVKHDRRASKIHVLDEFIFEDECDMMEELAKSTLHRAVVADGKGGSEVSNHRKAMQAGIAVPWDEEVNDNPVARVSRRVLDYTNHVLRLNIDEHGQEDLMSIQYFGRGGNDTEPDQYTPHCDGDCTGLPHIAGSRMATMVMYCKVADVGGHTNFGNAGVHVKPEKYSAVFFSYIDPVERIMDNGFTQHSGCPVFEGEKKIVTQWIRLGVDKENPWDSFNTLGIKLSDLEDDENDDDDDDDAAAAAAAEV